MKRILKDEIVLSENSKVVRLLTNLSFFTKAILII